MGPQPDLVDHHSRPRAISAWFQGAALGLIGAVKPPQHVPAVLAALAAEAVVLAGFDPRAIAECAARIREAARDAELPNPVPALMALLLDHLAMTIGPDKAAQIIDRPELDEVDREVVRELLFDVTRRDGPLDS